MCQCHYFQYLVCPPLLSMTAWMRRIILYTRDSQYSWVILVTQTSLIACLKFSALVVCYLVLLLFSSQILDWFVIWAVPGSFQQRHLVFSSGTQWPTLIGDKERHLAWRSCSLGCSCAISVSFGQFHVLGSIHSGVRRNEKTDQQHHSSTWHPKSFGPAGVPL